jgi:outer membrane lipoprotein SlyB
MDRSIGTSGSILTVLVAVAFVMPASAQRAGQSVSVQYGVVTTARQVDLNSGAVPGGVLVGGALGLASASGKSSGKKARNAIIGAAAGGAVAGAAQGNTKGMLYEVKLSGAQGVIQIVSDQREIRIGDCVAVEKAGDTANIRRMSTSFCDSANAQAIGAVAPQIQREAEECLAAKQQLVDATTASAADLAAKKIELLCND